MAAPIAVQNNMIQTAMPSSKTLVFIGLIPQLWQRNWWRPSRGIEPGSAANEAAALTLSYVGQANVMGR